MRRADRHYDGHRRHAVRDGRRRGGTAVIAAGSAAVVSARSATVVVVATTTVVGTCGATVIAARRATVIIESTATVVRAGTVGSGVAVVSRGTAGSVAASTTGRFAACAAGASLRPPRGPSLRAPRLSRELLRSGVPSRRAGLFTFFLSVFYCFPSVVGSFSVLTSAGIPVSRRLRCPLRQRARLPCSFSQIADRIPGFR